MAERNPDRPAGLPDGPGRLAACTTITLLGQDLADDVMGTVGFGELAFWLATQRRPTPGETRVFEAVLAALADHGFTPTAIVTRLTYLSAPDSVQGALAAGLLGGGSRFLGVTEDCGRFLHDVSSVDGPLPTDDAGWDALALETVTAAARPRGGSSPASATTCTRTATRAPRGCSQIAAEEELLGPHLSLFAAIGRVHPQVLGKTLPLNGAGVCGAALADLGLPLELLRGFALLARTAGLIGQLAEELRHPVANEIFLSVDLNNRSVAPDPVPRPDPTSAPQPNTRRRSSWLNSPRSSRPPTTRSTTGPERRPVPIGRPSPTNGSPRRPRSGRR